MLLLQYLKKFIIFIKYRKLLFRKIGKNCEYKFLNSIFHYPENIELSDNVHIGDYADFCGRGGIFIGKGAIIGVGSIVSKDIPDYAIAVGNPIEIKKYRNKEVFDSLYKKDISVFEKLGHKKELINESNPF